MRGGKKQTFFDTLNHPAKAGWFFVDKIDMGKDGVEMGENTIAQTISLNI